MSLRPRRALVLATVLAIVASGPSHGQEPGRTSQVPESLAADQALPLAGLEVRGSPLVPASVTGRIGLTARLEQPVDHLELRIEDFGGETIRRLASGPREAGELTRAWNGRDERGRAVAIGAYRAVARAETTEGTQELERWVTVADRKVYPARPGFITVALDPGHDATRSGAVGKDGTREADLNLDIAHRLAAMLEGAGVNVVMTRVANVDVNDPPVDLTGDGVADDTDELAARPDIANRARADLFISVHNNFAVNESVGGPSTFYSDERPFSDRSAQLARTIQSAMVQSLSRFAGAWEPYDHGALTYPYYVLRGYDPPRLQRPTQMPGVLSEGLFLSNPRELRLLKRPLVRQAMAEAYYTAIATYLAARPSHVGYALVDGPAAGDPGARLSFRVEVRNQGSEPMRGWRLAVSALRAPQHYEGRGRTGRRSVERRIPPLLPGEKTELAVRLTAPSSPGDWLLLFDARDPGGRRASRLGSPVLQVPLQVLDGGPSDAASGGPPLDARTKE